MTERLYYNDPTSREFDATVLRVDPRGDRSAVWLDRSAFYPTTGGQPFDTGRLGGLAVVDVTEDDAGDVVHVVSGSELPTVGMSIHGAIDWPRRFDHIQQHSGQHVLSAALVRVCHARTVSFHLGSEVSTIDLEREVSPDELTAAETAANQVIWENRPVTISYRDAGEAAQLPLRKKSLRSGTLRLIDIADWDLSACGGTHVASTGAIGVIAALSWERFRGGQRIEFVCGGRALTAVRRLRDATNAAGRLLSVLPHEIPGAIERLQHEAREQKKSRAALADELAGYQASSFAAAAEVVGAARLVIRAVDGDAQQARSLASAIVAAPGLVVGLVTAVTPATLVVARSADVPLSSQAVVAAVTAVHGGRGGGRPDLAQAGGLQAPADAVLAATRAEVLKLLA